MRALPCGGDAIARGAAGRIVDGRTFALEDGREVRLAAIEVPPLAPPGEAREAEAAPGGVAAKDAPAALLEGADIVSALTFLKTKTTRWSIGPENARH